MEGNRRRYKLLRITLNNFRVYGNNTIEFAIDDKKRITIIEGANGTGKTTLLNAITWCLYDEELHLPPISRTKEEFKKRPNIQLSKSSSDDRIKVSVELIFGDEKGNPVYKIKREEFYEWVFNEIRKSGNSTVNILRLEKNNWKIENNPDLFINMFLPQSIHEFYFFDGEQLDEFFKDKSNDNVKKAIEKLSQIELLDNTRKHLEIVKAEIYKSLKHLSPRFKEKQKDFEDIENDIERLEEKLDKLKNEKRKIEDQLKAIEDELTANKIEEIKQLTEKRGELEKELRDLENDLKYKKAESIKHLISYAPFVYCKDALTCLYEHINNMVAKGELPPKIKQEFVQELLQRETCICGTPLLPNSPQRSKLEEYLISGSSDRLIRYILDNRYLLNNLINNDIASFKAKRIDYGKDLVNKQEKIDGINRNLKEISDKLTDNTMHESIKQLEEKRQELHELKDRLSEDIGWTESELEQKKREKERLEKELKEELRKEKHQEELSFKLELCENAIKKLTQIKDEIIKDVRSTVSNRTEKYFRELIWKKGNFTISIDENYNISVKSDDREILGILSAGEREVLALAFIAALRDVIDIRLPVIIDTPLARISTEPRKNIAKLLPRYLDDTQLILLVTDQEYTRDIRELLREYVGKELILEFNTSTQQTAVKER